MQRHETIIIAGASQGNGAALVSTFVERGVAVPRRVSRSAEMKSLSRLALVDGNISNPATAKNVDASGR
jgi:NAD(P)-dependent dehydrogenase (short-subunit alcohol dehydrogenase family)